MLIEIFRDESNTTTTTGMILIDGDFFSYSLEDKVREKKVFGKTAIPAGSYKAVVTRSPRFKRDMVLIKGVPGFSGIRIHSGNTHEDTHGCILVAKHVKPGIKIWGDSRALERRITAMVKEAGEVDVIVHKHQVLDLPNVNV